MALYIIERAESYIEPFFFLLVVVYAAILTIFNVIFIRRRPQDLLSYSKYSDQIFGRWFRLMGPLIAHGELSTPLPSLVFSAHGTVLEIGPGSGNQLPRYDPAKITKIYGIEPCVDLHPALREAAKKAGLGDVYTIVPCSVEDVAGLKAYAVDGEAFDCALSCQVLCSVPHPRLVAGAVWRLLKPGGEMIVYEHVRSRDFLTLGVQKFYQLVWPYAIAGCCIDRDTATTVRQAGEWAKVDLQLPTAAEAFQTFPKIWGRLIKVS